jgi:hypothetical protein
MQALPSNPNPVKEVPLPFCFLLPLMKAKINLNWFSTAITAGISLCLALLLLLALNGCTVPEEKPDRERARNDQVYFPPFPFHDVCAVRLHNPGNQDMKELVLPGGDLDPEIVQSGKILSPAHRGDVAVALASSSVDYSSKGCFNPQHAIIWKSKTKVIAALLLSFQCNTYKFEPPSKVDLRDKNMNRLRTVFEETELIDN